MTGVGLSVENKYVNKLSQVNSGIRVVHKDYTPIVRAERLEYTEIEQTTSNTLTLNVGDSKFGWSNAMDIYFDIISSKQYSDIEMIIINYDNVRPKGERLKTFGGYASGHENLKTMFTKIDTILKKKPKGWVKLKPIDALDFATIIAENVISGGVRRSALIIFTDQDGEEVIQAKSNLYTQKDGQWEVNKDLLHRSLSNNTVKYYSKPSRERLRHHIETMRFTGEPGFDNMEEAYRRREDAEGFNPCNEIILRDRGVCNLTEVNMARYVDNQGNVDYEGLYEAQKYSALIGYRMTTVELEIHKWNLVNVEDRLVGCSLTGMTDFMQKANLGYKEMKPILRKLRKIANDVSSELAKELDMNEPKLVTTIKPSGTISQLPTVASGLHFNHSRYYIRRVRVNADDPIAKALEDNGFKWAPETGQTEEKHDTKVFEFPVEAPGTKFKGDVGAIEQLEWYKLIMEEYVDHNASITVHVRDNEWEDVEEWVYNNWDSILGVSFLPYDGGVYALAPYEKINKEEYEKMLSETPIFNTKLINKYEKFDEEFDILDSSCDAGFCPIR